MKKLLALSSVLALTACAATQQADAVAPGAPGFLLGLWHGFIFPVAWIVSLFVPNVAVYAVPNNGGWYDFGYFLGIVVFGVGARKSHDRLPRPRRPGEGLMQRAALSTRAAPRLSRPVSTRRREDAMELQQRGPHRPFFAPSRLRVNALHREK